MRAADSVGDGGRWAVDGRLAGARPAARPWEGGRGGLCLERPIVPGAMTVAIRSRVVTDGIGAQGRLHSLDISFRRPVQQGDVLRISGLVTGTSDEDGPRVMLDVFMANERGERPRQGTAVGELPRRPA